jgi:asparagine synthase (glutamine-hydrolysing)
MAHGVEIRVPLVDVTLLKALAPAIPRLAPGMGKEALAKAPTVSLPAEIVVRQKTGFGVPIGAWMNSSTREAMFVERDRPIEPKGLMSRRWSRAVLGSFASAGWA